MGDNECYRLGLESHLTKHTARRLFDELTAAEMAYRITGVAVADFCRRRANKHLGETRRELLRVAALGDDANLFMDYFLDGMNDENDAIS